MAQGSKVCDLLGPFNKITLKECTIRVGNMSAFVSRLCLEEFLPIQNGWRNMW